MEAAQLIGTLRDGIRADVYAQVRDADGDLWYQIEVTSGALTVSGWAQAAQVLPVGETSCPPAP
jgi:hypothetical protein